VNVVEIYNPVTDTWSTGSPMPQALSHSGAAYLGGKIFVAGGFTSAGILSNSVYAYDPITDSWSTMASLPVARAGLTLSTVFNGSLGVMRIFAIGGTTDVLTLAGSTLNTEYNPITNTWTSRAAMPTARYLHGAAGDYTGAAGTLNVGRLHVFGGRNGATVLGNYQYYEASTNTWTSASLMPSPTPCYGLNMYTYSYISGPCISDAVTFFGGNTGSGLLTQHLRLTTMWALPQQQHNLWVTPVSASALDISWILQDQDDLAEVWLEKDDGQGLYFPLSEVYDPRKGLKHEFTERDDHLWQGLNQYRLGLRHLDGSVTFSEVVSWEAQVWDWSVVIGPMPATESTTLSVSRLLPESRATWTALDIRGTAFATGAFLTDRAGHATTELQTRAWPAGTCWIKVTAAGQSRTQKLLVVH
jgi:Kelch motif